MTAECLALVVGKVEVHIGGDDEVLPSVTETLHVSNIFYLQGRTGIFQ